MIADSQNVTLRGVGGQFDALFMEILKKLDNKNDTVQMYIVFGAWIAIVVIKSCLKTGVREYKKRSIKKKLNIPV
nr:ORF12 [Darna trima granulovirus]